MGASLTDAELGVAERDELLTAAACRCLRDLRASAVSIYLHAPKSSMLDAVVVAVTLLGVGALDNLSVDDDVYASTVAFRSGNITTRHSMDILGKHPDLAVFTPFPFTTAAVPLSSTQRRFGALTVRWAETFHTLTHGEKDYLAKAGAELSLTLDSLAAAGVCMEPPQVPIVVVPAAPDVDAQGTGPPAGGSVPAEAPLLYHLHKLAVQSASVTRTEDAADLALKRVMGAFSARAMALSLVEADRLRVVGAVGCSREFLGTLNGLPVSRSTPETEAIAQTRQFRHEPWEEQVQGRVPAGGSGVASYSWVVLPLLAEGRAVGVCSLAFDPDDRHARAGEPVLTALSGLLGEAFERTQLHDAQHALAQKLQETLLPRMLPQPAGVLVTSRYVPTTGGIELGGDWYDLISLPDGGLAAVVGDVEGHSTAAAVVMGQLRTAVRAYASEGHDPASVLARTNHLLIDLDTGLFATCCCLWIDSDTGAARIADAGHPPPMIRTVDGRYEAEDISTGTALGIEPDPDYQATDLTLEPGTTIALYTNGLSGRDERPLREAFESALTASDGELETLGDQLIGAVGPCSTADDTALLLMRFEGRASKVQRQFRQLAIQRRDLQGVHRARKELREWLRTWSLDSAVDEAELLTSEVVTNALVHGDSDVSVCVRQYPDHIRVEVRDSDPHPARPVTVPRAEDEAEGGRGLLIVSALASGWGNSPSGRGKTVWFELPAEAGSETPH
ncbi:SpoIIE family protein phosphatase [Streptomyces sp. NPDC002573]|uniref:ATP-binding SpoIIE family protein phosphatase n=1 Tax=Streptomyces sp. NPDC002573 TaxID=3364651 RepID=UPI0036804393